MELVEGFEIYYYRGISVNGQVKLPNTGKLDQSWKGHSGDRYDVVSMYVTNQGLARRDPDSEFYNPEHVQIKVRSSEDPRFERTVGILLFRDYLLLPRPYLQPV